MTALLDDLVDWLRIPSVSTGEPDHAALEQAAQWVVDRVRAAGGEAEQVVVDGGHPLAVGELRAADEAAPTVLIYGHYDVQGPGVDDAWTAPPFEPEVRDGRLYARGASDDKGNFLPLLHVACAMARDGTLPVHVRVLVEGEEERAGEAVVRWVRADQRGADVAIVFDSGMPDPETPAVTVGLRGMVDVDVAVRTAERNLHSGLYGGAVLNALHVLLDRLANVMPGPDGRVRPELRAGAAPVADAELESWRGLVPGDLAITEGGGHPVAPGAGDEFYERTGAAPSVEVNHISGGEPRTVVPPTATAKVTMRLAPGQDTEEMKAVLLGLLREGLPAGAELDTSVQTAMPVLFEVDQPAIQLAARALERACGRAPAFLRSGGSIPIVAEMAAQGYPVIAGGFGLPEDAIHAPDESYALRSLEWGEAAARELYLALAELPR
ncbi:MAG TPA: M20/M25/M40 family metallo-hydrolase [Thermoleophilaceae bacterium]|nr:M20/M25/M40 family metallo-hydrolase [Thermoleophilaceae bacterium]